MSHNSSPVSETGNYCPSMLTIEKNLKKIRVLLSLVIRKLGKESTMHQGTDGASAIINIDKQGSG